MRTLRHGIANTLAWPYDRLSHRLARIPQTPTSKIVRSRRSVAESSRDSESEWCFTISFTCSATAYVSVAF